MTISQTEAASRKVRRARTKLDAALASGDDANPARLELESAQAALDKASAAEAERKRATEADFEEQARGLANDVTAEVHAAMRRIFEGITLPDAPALGVELAANALRGRQEAAQAAAALDDAKARLQSLQERHGALRANRAAIVTRRAGGEHLPDDGATLALLDADIEGLQGLIEKTGAEVGTLGPLSDEASAAREHAEKRWRGDVYRAQRAGIASLTLALEQAIAQAGDELIRRAPTLANQSRYVPADVSFIDHLAAVGYSPFGRR